MNYPLGRRLLEDAGRNLWITSLTFGKVVALGFQFRGRLKDTIGGKINFKINNL